MTAGAFAMTRRRVYVAVALLAVVGIVAAVVRPRDPRPGDGITPEAVAMIKPGMTLSEVEVLMGCPPGTYATDRMYGGILGPASSNTNAEGTREEFWGGWRVAVGVYFGPQDIAFKVKVYDVVQTSSGLGRALRGFLYDITHW